jgi:hypothetical protein
VAQAHQNPAFHHLHGRLDFAFVLRVVAGALAFLSEQPSFNLALLLKTFLHDCGGSNVTVVCDYDARIADRVDCDNPDPARDCTLSLRRQAADFR